MPRKPKAQGPTATHLGNQTYQVKFKPARKQAPFVYSSARYKLGGGARGGGKTYSLAGMAVNLSLDYPGNIGFAGRRDMDAFRNTTLKEILSHIPKGLCREPCPNKTEKVINIVTPKSIETGDSQWDSIIYYGELKDAGSLLSGNLGWFLIDEAFEVPQLSFTHLGGTLRHVLPDGTVPPRYGLLASNPSPGWLMDVFPVMEEEQAFYQKMVDQFGDMWMPQMGPLRSQFPEKTISYDFAYFPFLAEDNEFLLEKDPGYVRNLINDYKHDPVLLARYVYGRWDVSMAGLIYQLSQAHRWNPKKPGQRLYMANEPVFLGIDPSNGSGSYAATVWQTWRNRLYIVDEYKVKGATDDNFTDWLNAQPYANSITDAISDSARPDTIKRLRLMGVPARHTGKKDQIAQVNALGSLLRIDPSTGYARLLIDESMAPQMIRELGLYQWKTAKPGEPTSEIPLKRNDDLINSAQYVAIAKFPVASKIFSGASEYRPARVRSRKW